MYRAQGILKRWKEFKITDNEHSRTVSLMDFLQYQYKRYLELCDRCSEMPVPFGKWLLQTIDKAN
jgi:hypothetical protein